MSLFALALLLEAVSCATLSGRLAGDRRIFIEVDITPATFSDAFVILHVDGQRAGVLCPAFNPIDCSSSSGSGISRASTASTYLSIETQMQASKWNNAPHTVYASVESHFGRHMAFASAAILSGASPGTSPPSSPSYQEDADNTKTMNIVIFSKDRPSQLDLLTRSLKR
jgi:hypothetical protein